MRTARIADPVYHRVIYLVFDFSSKAVEAYHKRHFGEKITWNEDGRMYSHTDESGYTRYYIFLQSKEMSPANLASLGHEVFHLTMAILYAAGMKYTLSSEEAFAYFFGKIYGECAEKLRRANGKSAEVRSMDGVGRGVGRAGVERVRVDGRSDADIGGGARDGGSYANGGEGPV